MGQVGTTVRGRGTCSTKKEGTCQAEEEGACRTVLEMGS